MKISEVMYVEGKGVILHVKCWILSWWLLLGYETLGI